MNQREAKAINTAIRWVAMRHRARAAELLATVGLNIGQELLLLQLDAHGERTQAQLAAGAGCEPPTITMAVRKLEAAGLVHKVASPTDARAVVVTLTEAGRALLPQVREVLQQLAEESTAGLTRAEREALVARLQTVIANLDAAPPVR